VSPVTATPIVWPCALVKVRAVAPAVPVMVIPAACRAALLVTWLARSVRAKAVVVTRSPS